MTRSQRDAGVTLLELLAALAIATVIMGVILMLTQYTLSTWKTVTTQERLHAAVQLVDGQLQDVIQNLQDVAYDPARPQGTAIVGHDPDGQTIEIAVQDPSVDGNLPSYQGSPVVGVLITKSSSGQAIVLREPGVTFAGSSFSIDPGGKTVTAVINAQWLGPGSQVSFHQSATFALNGGI